VTTPPSKREFKEPGTQKHFREAQEDVAKLCEFSGNVAAVRTAPFWDDKLQALQERMETYWPEVEAKVAEGNDTSWENKMKHMAKNYKPAEWRLLQGASNGGYHYLGAAKIMAPIGKAFAEANLALMK
jgi:alpha-galactosidase